MIFSLLYNMVLILLAILLSPLWGLWMACVPKIRAGFFEKLGCLPPDFLEKLKSLALTNRLWVHAVSVGELNAAKPMINSLLKRGYPVILSTTTETGNKLAQKLFPELPIFYFPFDLPWVVRKVLARLKPTMIIILETELWPNLIAQASCQGVSVLLVNGRLSQDSFKGYLRLKPFFRWVLGHFRLLLMQSQADAKRMLSLGADEAKVIPIGNLKFDLPPVENPALEEQLRELFRFPPEAPVITFASTHKGEEELFIQVFDRLKMDFPDLRAVLAPRHPERSKWVATMLTAHGTHFTVRSQLSSNYPNPSDSPVVLLDTVGELNAVYALSTLACVGGSFIEWGGHNPLEPINANIPVIFGPSMENFADITRRVLEAHAGFQAQSPQEAEQFIRELLTRPEYYEHIIRNGQRLMAENKGVVEAIVSRIESCLHLGNAVSLSSV